VSAAYIRSDLTRNQTDSHPGHVSSYMAAPIVVGVIPASSVHESYEQCNLQATQRANFFPGNSMKASLVSPCMEQQQDVTGGAPSLFSFAGDSTVDFHVGSRIQHQTDIESQSEFSSARTDTSNLHVNPIALQHSHTTEKIQDEHHIFLESRLVHDIAVEGTRSAHPAHLPAAEPMWSSTSESTEAFRASPAPSIKHKASTRELGTAANELFYAHLIEVVRRP
jgi:hypothetical protein